MVQVGLAFQAHNDISGDLDIAIELVLRQIEPHKVRWALSQFLANLRTKALHAVLAEIDVFNSSLVKKLQYLPIKLISNAIPGQINRPDTGQLINALIQLLQPRP